jgi:hypothetical protein
MLRRTSQPDERLARSERRGRRLGRDARRVPGVVNDAVAVYYCDVSIAGAFVARWCQAQRVEIVDGLFQVRDDEPARRVAARDTSRRYDQPQQ